MLPSNTATADDKAESTVIGDLPEWGVSAIADFTATLMDRSAPFPCTFAVTAARRSALRFGFVDDAEDSGTWSSLPDILTGYLGEYQSLGRETSLVVLFGGTDSTASMEHHRRRFWEVLQYLHDHDPQDWPPDVPQDTDDPYWEFSFAGTPIFVVCNTPAHVSRRSRSSPHFMITFQPRWVFEEIGALSPRGAAARKVIRNRLRAYDGVEPSPDLGDYGNPENKEWRQYFLSDVDPDPAGEPSCPFRHR